MNEWIWMPHAGHLCVGHSCRFHLNTYVNGYIVSTVGEYWPDQDVRRIFLKSKMKYPPMTIGENGKIQKIKPLSEKDAENLLALKGDCFDDAYLKLFGYEEIGMNRTYETMVFKARKSEKWNCQCCPWEIDQDSYIIDCSGVGYNCASEAYEGHMEICHEWDKKVHASKYVGKECPID